MLHAGLARTNQLQQTPTACILCCVGQSSDDSSFYLTAVCVWHLHLVAGCRKEETAKKAEKQLLQALEQFRAVLKADPSNAYAANGVGAALVCCWAVGHFGHCV